MKIVRSSWFDRKLSYNDIIGSKIFYCYQGEDTNWFKKDVKLTKLIDLKLSNEEINSSYDKKCRNEVLRSKKEGITYYYDEQLCKLPNFITAYEELAKNVGLKSIKEHTLSDLNVVLTYADFNECDLVFHLYVLCDDTKIVRLLHSVSMFRNSNENIERKFFGWANRGLHDYDIKKFKSLGYETYDLGGYAQGVISANLVGINKFKDSFGGEFVEVTNLVPLHIHLLSLVFKFLRKVKFG